MQEKLEKVWFMLYVYLFSVFCDREVHNQIHIWLGQDKFGFMVKVSKNQNDFTLLFGPNGVFIESFRFLLTNRTKIRCRRFSALPCNTSYHTFLLQSKTRLRESNIQQDNFHFYIDFSYSDEIHYHISIWIVLDYYSRDRGCHKIPGSNKENLMSTQLNLSITIF